MKSKHFTKHQKSVHTNLQQTVTVQTLVKISVCLKLFSLIYRIDLI